MFVLRYFFGLSSQSPSVSLSLSLVIVYKPKQYYILRDLSIFKKPLPPHKKYSAPPHFLSPFLISPQSVLNLSFRMRGALPNTHVWKTPKFSENWERGLYSRVSQYVQNLWAKMHKDMKNWIFNQTRHENCTIKFVSKRCVKPLQKISS